MPANKNYLSYVVRIETSGPLYRGFAIQARESTPSFSSSAAFVGEFVNPPPGANWEIWNCVNVRKVASNQLLSAC